MFNILANETYNAVNHNLEMLGQNVQNMNMSMAPGYKAKKMTFHESLNGLRKVETTDFKSGVSIKTGRELDFAIDGAGFFEVLLPDGTVAYTRNGALSLSAEGRLQTPYGYEISTTAAKQDLSEADKMTFSLELSSRPVFIPAGVDIKLNEKGELIDPNNEVLGKINLVTFTNLNGLKSIGEGLYVPTRAAGDMKDIAIGDMRGETQLKQGFLEASNADAVYALSQILQLNTAIKAEMKVFKTLDQMHGELNQTISRNL